MRERKLMYGLLRLPRVGWDPIGGMIEGRRPYSSPVAKPPVFAHSDAVGFKCFTKCAFLPELRLITRLEARPFTLVF